MDSLINEQIDLNSKFRETDFNYEKTNKCICGSLHDGWLQLEELQLVALACFFLSCKFWERFPPKVAKFF